MLSSNVIYHSVCFDLVARTFASAGEQRAEPTAILHSVVAFILVIYHYVTIFVTRRVSGVYLYTRIL